MLNGSSRRQFLWTFGFAIAALSLRKAIAFEASDLTKEMVRIFRDYPSCGLAIGRGYLAAVPSEASEAELTSLIIGDGTKLGPLGLKEWLDSRIRKDFDEDRVVSIGGWILSATEARLCALVTLS
jgi:hypothetical protein